MSASMPESWAAGIASPANVSGQRDVAGIPDRAAGTGFRAIMFVNSDRARELERREQFFQCTQHDWKKYDFDGRALQPGRPYSQPLLSSEVAPFYVPLRMRRPSSPYRLGRVIVRAFTNMLFGEQRFPKVTVAGDEDTQDFVEALIEATAMPVKLMQARDIGGGSGTVGLSWCYHEGKPRVDVHHGKHCHVHEWASRDDLIPAHVSEIYRCYRDEYDDVKGTVVRNWYWYRRDWTEESDVYFKEVPVKQNQRGMAEPVWEVDQERSLQHDDGFCHFVWVQNRPSTEVDGVPDYDQLYESLDFIDILYSILGRGTVSNLDPTLVLHMDLDLVQRMGIKKGSDNALTVGTDGSAEYLELGGSSIEIGLKLFEAKRRTTLEVAQCVITDSDKLAANGVSSVALKMIYSPMIAACDAMREQYGTAIQRLIEQMVKVAQDRYGESIITVDEEGNEEKGQFVVTLPPKVTKEPILDEDGKPTEEDNTIVEERQPGEGTHFQLVWGQWFAPTPTDQSAIVTMLTGATGGKAFMAPDTAVELMASAFNRDQSEELKRMKSHNAEQQAAQMQMMGDPGAMGGQVDTENALPDGVEPRPGAKPGEEGHVPASPPEGLKGATGAPEEAISIPLTSTDVASVVTVNEYRIHTLKLGPLPKSTGGDDPDGYLTITEFKAKRASDIAKAAQADKGTDPDKPPPPMPAAFGAKPGVPSPKPGEPANRFAVSSKDGEQPGKGEPPKPPPSKPPFPDK